MVCQYDFKIFKWLSGIPVICTVHTVCEHEGFIRNAIEKLVTINPTLYIAVSDSVAQSLITNRHINSHLIKVIKNGIETIELNPTLKKSNDYFTFGSVGRFVPVKNYDLLIKCFAVCIEKNSNCRLMLIGHGPEESKLKKLARKFNIEHKVIFITGQKAQPYYSQFDCFVQPSQFEGLSLALLEALHSHVPAIVTSPTKTHDIIRHRYNGYIIEPNNYEQLIEALRFF